MTRNLRECILCAAVALPVGCLVALCYRIGTMGLSR